MRRAARREGRPSTRSLAAGLLAFGVTCVGACSREIVCNDGEVLDAQGHCAEREPGPGQSVDWTNPAALYAPAVRVHGDDNGALAGATVRVLGRTFLSDGRGIVRMDALAVGDEAVASVSAAGHAPTLVRLTAADGGRHELRVRLKGLGPTSVVDVARGGTVTGDGVALTLSPHALVTADGRAYDGEARVTLTTLDAERDATATPPAPLAFENGASSVFLDAHVFVHVAAVAADGRALAFGPKARATLRAALPASATVPNGADIPLFCVDASRDEGWRARGTCRVQPVGGRLWGDVTRSRECIGVVRELGWWGIGQPRAQGACQTVPFEVLPPSGFTVAEARFAPEEPWATGLVHFYAGGSECVVGPRAPAKARGVLHVDLVEAASGRRARWWEPVTPGLLAEAAALRTTFAARTAEACGACAEAPRHTVDLAPRAAALAAQLREPSTDDDEDGFPAPPQGAEPVVGVHDCAPADPRVHPGAREIPCNGKDDDCDGVVDGTGPLSVAAWNAFCRTRDRAVPAASLAACAPRGLSRFVEVAGNEIDEDCDGALGDDVDGDRDANDCDDRDPTVRHGVAEVSGNLVDENCDGVVVDADGDGFPGAAAYTTKSAGFDCDDYDAAVSPDEPKDPQPFAIGGAFYRREGGAVVRNAAFCDLVVRDGTLYTEEGLASARPLLRDATCDGHVSDLDGDGWTVPGDDSLGADRAWDCDDLDPRVHPAAGTVVKNDRPPACVRDGGADEIADAACRSVAALAPLRHRFGKGPRNVCPTFDGTTATCADMLDSRGQTTGRFVCDAPSFRADPPRPYAFGRAFGPCATVTLFAGVGSTCLAEPGEPELVCVRGAYSDAYKAQLRAWLGQGVLDRPGVTFGVCLPRCGDACFPNTSCAGRCTVQEKTGAPVCGH